MTQLNGDVLWFENSFWGFRYVLVHSYMPFTQYNVIAVR